MTSLVQNTILYHFSTQSSSLRALTMWLLKGRIWRRVLLVSTDLRVLSQQSIKKNFHCLDPVHGHGSQSLINLMVTGVATQNVFDGDKDLCGLQLRGISAQSDVGFLSYLECLR